MEFKIGDRVENQQRGKGTVCAIDGRLYSIGVNFDIGAPEMHSCSRKCPEGHGWFLGTSELSLIGSEKVERFEVGKWYQCDNGRGPGRHIGCHSCGWPGFYYPNWNNGHNGNGQPGIPKEVGNHCWYELGDFREVPAERVNGRHGVIENDDHSSSPYNIRVDNGGRYWFTEEEVVPEAPDKMGGEGPTTRDFQADRLAEDRTGTVRAFRGSRQGRARQALRQGGQVIPKGRAKARCNGGLFNYTYSRRGRTHS